MFVAAASALQQIVAAVQRRAMSKSMENDDKRAAAVAAVAEVRGGMLVGLGTGSTAAFAIRALGGMVADGLTIRAVATSLASEALARSAGIDVVDLATVDFAAGMMIDLTIDGADEIAPDCTAIKGAGGAMLREKIVAAASRRMVVVADGSKRVARLGAAPLPVEVLPFARRFAGAQLAERFARVTLRGGDADPYLTDNRNIVFDCHDILRGSWPDLATALSAIPGVVGHGLFLTEVDAAYIASGGIVTRVERDGSSG